MERVSELEGVVGSVVSEADATIAVYKNQVTDLAQQVSSGTVQYKETILSSFNPFF